MEALALIFLSRNTFYMHKHLLHLFDSVCVEQIKDTAN